MPTIARSNSASATKSRSLTASSELAKTSPKPEGGGGGGGIDRQRRPGQRAGAERRHVEALDGGDEPVDVARERPAVGQQVVGQQHRLGPLHVGVAGEVGVAGRLGPGEQDVLQGDDEPGDVDQLALAPQPQVGGDLVVAAARRVQLGAGRSGQLGDAPLDRGVDVLVARDERERVAGQLVLDLVERAEDRASTSSSVEQPGPLQAADVGARAGDVVAPQPAVERQADGVGEQGVGRPAGEATVPERAPR